jgi:hypothetical protein
VNGVDDVPVIGVDWSANRLHVGLARGRVLQGSSIVTEVAGGRDCNPLATIPEWMMQAPRGVLAIDAPLGWPAPMGDVLQQHVAGKGWGPHTDDVFSRVTERFVMARTGKKPLEVGAQLIARTAYTALNFLEQLRERTGRELPLLWNPDATEEWGVIEVYPAATLKKRGLLKSGYGKTEESRGHCLQSLADHVRLEVPESAICLSGHRLDAVIATIAAADFVAGRCEGPVDADLAQREGWIWI